MICFLGSEFRSAAWLIVFIHVSDIRVLGIDSEFELVGMMSNQTSLEIRIIHVSLNPSIGDRAPDTGDGGVRDHFWKGEIKIFRPELNSTNVLEIFQTPPDMDSGEEFFTRVIDVIIENESTMGKTGKKSGDGGTSETWN